MHFLFVGILSLIKGADLLFQALDRLCPEMDFRLTTVGTVTPGFHARLKAETSRGLWERVTMKSGLTPEQVGEEMEKATMVLFPTRADNSPNSIKESAVAGVPVVASAVGGIVDYIKDGLNGVTFAGGNLDEFVNGIRRAVAHPLLGQGKVQAKALEEARRYLSPALMREGFMAAYERVLWGLRVES